MGYFKGNELAKKVWEDKYALKNKEGELIEKSPKEMWRRMAKEFARIESNYPNPLSEDEIYELFKDFNQVIPQGSIMNGLGNPQVMSLSNCTVVDSPVDSYGGIMYADEQLAQLMKRRCGVGLDISSLRPNGSSVNNAAGSSTGAVSFMERFSNTTLEVAQGGRRGALMLTIDVSHPDVKEFVSIKSDLTKVTGANISLRISDEFMKAVQEDGDYELTFKDKVYETVKAKDLWNLIISQAHASGEPGIHFWDRHHNYSTSSIYPEFRNKSTNPCGEQALQANDSCRLIALNLYGFVKNPFTIDAVFDFKKFNDATYKATKLNDDLVDLELEAIIKIIDHIEKSEDPQNIKQREIDMWKRFYDTGKKGRRIGLGFTGLGDTLAALGLKYDSEFALNMVENIMSSKMHAEFESSIDMAIDRGGFEAFSPAIDNSSEFIQMFKNKFPFLYVRMMKYGRRNINISTVAPTGSLSILADVTSGLEPLFMPYYTRNKKVTKDEVPDFTDENGIEWKGHYVLHGKFKLWLELHNWDVSKMSENDLEKEFKHSPWYGSTANDIDWIKRIEMQSVIQKYTTNSISSTINLPNDVSVEEVGNIYMEAWKQGLKGITVYRDGSRTGVLVSKNDIDEIDGRPTAIKRTVAPKRPKEMLCDIHHLTAKGTKYTVLIGLLKDEPYEVFAFESKHEIDKFNRGVLIRSKKNQYDLKVDDLAFEGVNKLIETDEEIALTRMISTSLRHGADMSYIVEQLQKSNGTVVSFTKAIARVLKTYSTPRVIKTTCPECGGDNYVMENGCAVCKDCGHSGCS